MAQVSKATPLDALCDVAAKQSRSADIARIIGVDGKTVRNAVRSGRLTDGNGKALPAVYVSKDGANALTDAHKRAIVRRFVKSDDDATRMLKH